MTPILNGKTDQTAPISLAKIIEDHQNVQFNASELLLNYNGVGDLSITNLAADYGTIEASSDGKLFTYKPKKDYNGIVNLSYTVKDNNGSINGFNSFEITAINDAPELTGTKAFFNSSNDVDIYTINESALLQGFTDIDSQTLQVVDLTATHGTLKNNNDGSWSFTPTLNHSGEVELKYTVSDGQGGFLTEQTNSFQIAPPSDGPRITGSIAILPGGREGTPYTIRKDDLLKGFSDPNNDPLSITDLKANSGTLTDNKNGTWTLTSDDNFSSTVVLSYNVSDGQGNFKRAVNSLNLTAVNDAPVLSGNKRNLTGGLQNKEATLYAIDLLAGFSDPEGDRLSIVNISADKGSLSKLSNQAWTLTPNKDYTGDIVINFEVSAIK